MFRNPILQTFTDVSSVNDVCERGGIIWLACNGGKVKRSIDTGKTWTTYDLSSLIPGGFGNVNKVFGSHGFFPNQWRFWGANGQCAYTPDNGATWIGQNITNPANLTITDVEDTNGYLVGVGSNYLSVNVGGDFNGATSTGAGDNWFTVARDTVDVTHVAMGAGSNYNLSIFGWPPPSGHLLGSYAKGTAKTTVGNCFDTQNNLVFVSGDGEVGWKDRPAYSATAPAVNTPASMSGATTVAIDYGTDNQKFAVVGAKSGGTRIWIAPANTNAVPVWTEYDPYAEYLSSGLSWKTIERDDSAGKWLTCGSNGSSQGVIGIWTA